ncbi:MAG: fatty acid desaturase [Pseudomonadota bacterium]
MSYRAEMPTVLLLLLVYFVFLALPLAATLLPLWGVIIGLALIIALYSSLQHEVLHGHPLANQKLNYALVFPAFSFFIPYLRFKDTHLAHHHDANLTDPYDDPETNYLDPEIWMKWPRWLQSIARINNTLLGRMTIGPVISLSAFYLDDLKLILRGNTRVIWSYFTHVLGVVPVLYWVWAGTDLPLWAYFAAAYGGMAILKIRTFLEHQAHDRVAARSVIIEDRGLLALLFLNNNYHAVHHRHPSVVWHKLPQVFERRRAHFLRCNGGYAYASYRDVFARYLFAMKDPVPHPNWGASKETLPRERAIE